MTDEEERIEPQPVEPQPAQVAPTQVDIPEKPIENDRRGGEDERSGRHTPPRGPFRPMPDPGEPTTVEEVPGG